MYQVRNTIILLLLVLVMTPAALQAAVLEDFYQVEMPAREEQDRGQALREAFELMIARQAGTEAVDREAVQAAAQDPQAFMRRIAGTEAGGVRIDFEPAAIRGLLNDAGLPMLGPNRPTVMLWALEESAMGHELLSQSSDWASVLNAAAQRRAVALSLPLADLEDRALVDVQNIQQAEGDALKQASQRYDASAVLALTIAETPDTSVLDWSWWLNEQSQNGRITAESPASAADQLMLEVADLVFGQYAVSPSNSTGTSRWEVVVEGINTLNEFAGLQRTLQQLGSKEVPKVLSVKGDQVRLTLNFAGSESQLERLLALDQRLRRMPAPEPEPEPEPEAQSDQSAAITTDQQKPSAVEGAADAGPVEPEPMDQVEGEPALDAQPDMAAPEPVTNVMFFRWR